MRTSKTTPLLVLGLGNVLWGDDGTGAVAANILMRRYHAPVGTRVVDGGTLGFALLPLVQDAKRLLLIDAIRADAPPGSLVRIEGDDVASAVRDRLSPHQVGVADLLEAARWSGCYPEPVVLIGLVPESMEFGLERSAAVEAHLDELVERVVEEARALGFDFRPEAGYEELAGCGAGNAAGPDRVP